MSTIDACVLKTFSSLHTHPIVNYRIQFEGSLGGVAIKSSVMNTSVDVSIEEQSIAITNLARLGLVNIDFISKLTNDDLYAAFEKNEVFTQLSTAVALNVYPNAIGIKIDKGMVSLTPLGKAFIDVCLPLEYEDEC